MGKIKRNYLKLLLVIILAVFFIPATVHKFNLYPEEPLKGAVKEARDPLFSVKDWLSGKYQLNKERYIDQHFGFRNTLVRIYNQYLYMFFEKANARSVIIGKSNYLFEENYIKAYFGYDFAGDSLISERIRKAMFLQDTLESFNTTFIMVFAPGKGSFYPEYLPEQYLRKNLKTNYTTYMEAVNKYNLNHIDFNRYFIDNRFKSPHPLFPKHGTHWSYYGACLASDSIIKYIESARKTDLPDIFWNEIKTDRAKYEDYDIGDGLNLLYPLEKELLAYPAVQFESSSGKTKPSVLLVGDSFSWVLVNLGLSASFKNIDFWYYNTEIYQIHENTIDPPVPADSTDILAEIEKHDVVLIMAGESTLPDMGWGFIENAFESYHSESYREKRNKIYQAEILKLEQYIRSDSIWMAGIEKKAAERSISIDSMITLDAQYVVRSKIRK